MKVAQECITRGQPGGELLRAMTDAYGDAADYCASTGPPLAGQAADVARPPRATVRRWATRLAAWAAKPGWVYIGGRNTALPPACDGLPGTPWLLAPRRPLDKLDLFRLSQDGGVVFPFRRAHYQPAPDRP